jgi:hypothetical protein
MTEGMSSDLFCHEVGGCNCPGQLCCDVEANGTTVLVASRFGRLELPAPRVDRGPKEAFSGYFHRRTYLTTYYSKYIPLSYDSPRAWTGTRPH